ncbi:MAG: ABC transporter permease subunit [Planctomycetota bacterium]|jgi:ABC-type transport system involved in multi-copper enzyme maturation permease subunit
MNGGLIDKAVREMWRLTLLLGAAILAVEVLLAAVLPGFQEELSESLLQLQFFQTIFRALLGTDFGGQFGPQVFQSIAWVHPVILALTWTHAAIYCTRIPAGEVDRGTVDVLFGLPVSRWGLYVAETVVWLASGACVIILAWVGNLIGNATLEPAMRPSPMRLLPIIANLYCLYIAVGGVAWLVSASSDRRGRAIGIVFAIVLASFLLNFLAQFWEPAQYISFLGVLDYYQPVFILQGTTSAIGDMVVLLIFGAAMWLTGGFIFARRNICTV